jgi:hypothetical protein
VQRQLTTVTAVLVIPEPFRPADWQDVLLVGPLRTPCVECDGLGVESEQCKAVLHERSPRWLVRVEALRLADACGQPQHPAKSKWLLADCLICTRHEQ